VTKQGESGAGSKRNFLGRRLLLSGATLALLALSCVSYRPTAGREPAEIHFCSIGDEGVARALRRHILKSDHVRFHSFPDARSACERRQSCDVLALSGSRPGADGLLALARNPRCQGVTRDPVQVFMLTDSHQATRLLEAHARKSVFSTTTDLHSLRLAVTSSERGRTEDPAWLEDWLSDTPSYLSSLRTKIQKRRDLAARHPALARNASY
jgi:hypothetical protein